jgi:hypothetical protein
LPFEKLNLTFVLLGGFARVKRSQITTSSGLGVALA